MEEKVRNLLKVPEMAAVKSDRAEQIRKTFEPMAEMLSEFESSYNEILFEYEKGVDQKLTKRAKRLRLDIGKIRIQTSKLKDKQKEYIKLEDRAIMGVHNILVWAVKEKEDKLKEIETHFERLEAERKEKLHLERVEKVSPYLENAEEFDFREYSDEAFREFYLIKKTQYEDRVEAELKAEEERIAREKKEAEERKRIQEENQRLKREMEAERKKREAELVKEKEERERLAEELRRKEEAEKARLREEARKKEAELSKSEEDKFRDMLKELSTLDSRYNFKSKSFKIFHEGVCEIIKEYIDEHKV